MKKFDDFFSEKLNQEGQFPNQAKNWRGLHKRLDALDAGAHAARTGLRIWQGATLLTLLGAAVMYLKICEQKALISGQTQALAMTHEANKAHQAAVEALTAALEAVRTTAPQYPQAPAAVQKIFVERSAPDMQANLLNDARLAALEALVAKLGAVPSQAEKAPEEPDQIVPEKKVLPALDTAAAKNIKEAPGPSPQPEPAIDPLRKKMRFKAGFYAVRGYLQPKWEGVAPIKGQGLNLEYQLGRRLWLSTAFEWSTVRVNGPQFPDALYPDRDTTLKPFCQTWFWNNNKCELVGVRGEQQMQQIGLGIRYEIPGLRWLTPSIRAAYHWIHSSSAHVTYEYRKKNHHHGGFDPKPEYLVESFDANWQLSQLRLGIGLEKNFPRWTCGVYADFAKSIGVTTPGYDALFLRSGLQYKF